MNVQIRKGKIQHFIKVPCFSSRGREVLTFGKSTPNCVPCLNPDVLPITVHSVHCVLCTMYVRCVSLSFAGAAITEQYPYTVFAFSLEGTFFCLFLLLTCYRAFSFSLSLPPLYLFKSNYLTFAALKIGLDQLAGLNAEIIRFN